MRGRLFNLFKLFCVVASGSLSFSFVNLLLLLLLSPLLLPFSFELAFTRLLFKGDGRTLGCDCDEATLARLAGRFMLRRDVGRGTIEDFSVDFSALLSCSSTMLADSLTADDAVDSVTDAGEGRPRFLRLNWGREGLIKRDTVVLSASLVSLGLSVLPRRLNRFLAGLLRNLLDDEI